ncbi:hypothetical protein CCU68_24315 [Pseudomonas gingeri NCPPB 3146 = LMG 5327]|uniref:Uncharacterized protein n=2 Tax=Pseudomonas gingeri TaxID=117681 RepID=A0A7Y8CEB0_9PSED|nr:MULTISPECIES: hypothetical protein [Pseudomonas]NWC16060.1 hypothetical protein [Pseudomonas gingeri]PNQ89823.1 hypothetical protein CCU68_24315 [Pseudomonas gingeri NCPPB 3146 = LMG 5327]BBP75566.1 hypothetical protein PHLH7_16700 [Pseudomonas sp. Ost2]
MYIERPTAVAATSAPEDLPVRALERHLARPDHAAQSTEPGFEAFYQGLAALFGSGEKELLRFIGSYRSSDEGPLDYRTVGAQMKVVGQALSRLKDEGLEGSAQDKELRAVMARLFGTSMFISQYLQEIFNPVLDEDSREKADW